jgi:ligand-binding sensor domain-containing protein
MIMFPRSKKANLFLILIFILISSYYELSGQNYSITTYTTKEGLAHNKVTSIASDSSGFLWIGTWDGLSRFDGYEFKNYYHIPGDSTSLPYFSIKDIVVDRSNNLWILPDFKELTLFDRANEKFRIIQSLGDNLLENIQSITLDENKNLLIIAKNRLIKKDFKTGKYEAIYLVDKNGNEFILDEGQYDYSIENDSIVWLCGKQILKFTTENTRENRKCFRFLKGYQLEGSFFKKHLDFEINYKYSVFRSPSGNIWLFSNIGLFQLDEHKNLFSEVKGKIPIKDFTGRKRFFWGSISDGFYMYKPGNEVISHIQGPTHQLIGNIFYQSDELIWSNNVSLTGTSQGLSRIIITPLFFRNYPINEKGIDNPAIYCILKDSNNTIWTAVKGRDYISKILRNGMVKRDLIISTKQTEISGYLRSIIKVKRGLWLGYYRETLLFYDFKTGIYKQHSPVYKSFNTITTDKSGKLYIGGFNLSIYDPGSKETKVLIKEKENEIFYKLYFDTKGNLWCAMNFSKLLKYNIISGKSQMFKITSDNYNIEDILEDKKGNFWLALLGGGICKFNPETGLKKYYTTSTGLSNNTTYCLLMDQKGNIWISTNYGLSRFNPYTEQFRNFNRADGLEINEFNAYASFSTVDGELLFGGMGGIVGFYPDSLSQKKISSITQKVILTNVKVSGETRFFLNPVYQTDTIILNKGDNNFHITFSSRDFINSEKTMYRYRLTGVSNKWEETDSRNRTMNYSNLKPGLYNLGIEATDREGNWTASKTLTIIIKPYFYQTKFFIFIIPLLVLALITSIIIVYIKQFKQEEQQKQDTLRLQSLRGQMNPHFIFNSLNSINYFISNNDKLSANRYIADFARLIRSILSNMGSDYVPFSEELNSIRDYLNIEHLRFGDKFDFEIRTDEVSEPEDIEIFPGLVQPFVENAIWHGVRGLENRKGIITIKLSAIGKDKIKCSIEDDGIGRKISMGTNFNGNNHKSKGIGIVLERLQIISSIRRVSYGLSITDLYNDRQETGTLVKIDIPCKYMKNHKL